MARTSGPAGALTWDRVLAWRMRRQLLDSPTATGPTAVVDRVCGIQAQLASAAELAVAIRSRKPAVRALQRAVERRRLVKTWAARGTLHVHTVPHAAAVLSLVAAAGTWKRASWARVFVSEGELDALAEVVSKALDSRVLTREELAVEVERHTNDQTFAEHLRSSWGAILKPLAWQGLLCYGPSRDGRVTFTRPDTWVPRWPGLPDPAAAAQTVIPAYLGAFGPASPETFDQWLTRGLSKRPVLRGWFADLAGEIVEVDVEGRRGFIRRADAEDMAATEPAATVVLLPAFDQYVLGPGTRDESALPKQHRAKVSKTAGWISPTVLVGGRVAGTWESRGGKVAVQLFEDAPRVAKRALDAAVERVAELGAPTGDEADDEAG